MQSVKKLPIFITIISYLVGCAYALYASEPAQSNTSQVPSFDALLEEMSDIATKQSLNTDYLPAVVSVIEAQRFEEAGVVNLAQALSLLPGFQIQISPLGFTMTTVRGLKNPNAYLSDKIKIMIDGVTIHNEVTGSSNFYMDFPLQIIKKIEVLRGPGSTLYGAGSFYATINIVTKSADLQSDANKLYASFGSYDYYSAAATAHLALDDWKIGLDAYYQQNNKALFSQQKSPWDEREGYSDEAMKDGSIGVVAQYKNLTLNSRYKQNVSGNYYGFEGQFNPIEGRGGEHKNRYFFTEAKYEQRVDAWHLSARANYSHRTFGASANIYGINDAKEKFAKVDVPMDKGFVYREYSVEDNYEAELRANLKSFHGNDLLVGGGARYVAVTEDRFYSSVEEAILQNFNQIVNHPNYDDFRYRQENETAFYASQSNQLLAGNPTRSIGYVYLQDLLYITDKIDAILGVRFDHYSDFGPQWSKRLGLVYRMDDAWIFKLLYGSAFRAPTLIEAYQNGHINFRAGDMSIKPETTDTVEFVTIYKPLASTKLLLNLFYSKLKNVIDLEEYPNTDPGYQNYDSRQSRGVELEFFYNYLQRHQLYFNSTYTDTDYVIPPEGGEISIVQSMPDISPVMLKALYTYAPNSHASFSAIWQFYSDTTPTQLQWVKNAGIDSTVNAYHLIDVAMHYAFTPSTTLLFSVKNLFDADVRSPAYYYLSDGGVQREGINFYSTLSYQF